DRASIEVVSRRAGSRVPLLGRLRDEPLVLDLGRRRALRTVRNDQANAKNRQTELQPQSQSRKTHGPTPLFLAQTSVLVLGDRAHKTPPRSTALGPIAGRRARLLRREDTGFRIPAVDSPSCYPAAVGDNGTPRT